MKPTFDHSEALRLVKQGVPIDEVAGKFGVQRQTIYGIIRSKGVPTGVRAQMRNERIAGETDRHVRERVFAHRFSGDLADDRYVRRDPCPKCGVRGDIGCKHNPKGEE